jgi:hypothetical protein
MEARSSSETSVDFHQTTRRCIPEDRTLHAYFFWDALVTIQIKRSSCFLTQTVHGTSCHPTAGSPLQRPRIHKNNHWCPQQNRHSLFRKFMCVWHIDACKVARQKDTIEIPLYFARTSAGDVKGTDGLLIGLQYLHRSSAQTRPSYENTITGWCSLTLIWT